VSIYRRIGIILRIAGGQLLAANDLDQPRFILSYVFRVSDQDVVHIEAASQSGHVDGDGRHSRSIHDINSSYGDLRLSNDEALLRANERLPLNEAGLCQLLAYSSDASPVDILSPTCIDI
jgi:hypothetical protein